MAKNLIRLTTSAPDIAGTYDFEDVDYYGGEISDSLENSLIGENLSIDSLTFKIVNHNNDFEALADSTSELLGDSTNELLAAKHEWAGKDFRKFIPKKDTVQLYHNNTFIAKYFVTAVAQKGQNGAFTFTCESLMSVLKNKTHRGGIYAGASVGTIVADILSGISYTIDSELSAQTLSGWLPNSNCRDNLKQVLFACGASILKDSSGNILLSYNLSSVASNKQVSDVYIGSERKAISPATLITLTEHTFYASSATSSEVLYDNTTGTSASNEIITFKDPYHSYTVTGSLTIVTQNANYVVVSGQGSLSGKKYVHIERSISQSTGCSGDTNEVSVTSAYLVSASNSAMVLNRLINYYSQTEEITADIQTTTEKPATMLSIPDPDDYTKTVSGYIKSMQRIFSSNIKSRVYLTSGWTPKYFGNDYDSYVIITAASLSSGVYNVPSAMQGKKAMLVLVGGSQGGAGGASGECRGVIHSGIDGWGSYGTSYYMGTIGDPDSGGSGGAAGSGGALGKVLSTVISSLAASYSVSFGTGGAGGTGGTVTRTDGSDPVIVAPTTGSLGTHSTFGSFDSANGADSGAVINVLTGAIIAQSGVTGTAGGNGGRGGLTKATGSDYATYGKGVNGDTVGSYSGGTGASGSTYFSGAYVPVAGGGGGGGAAMGSSGGAGSGANFNYYRYWTDQEHTEREYILFTGESGTYSSRGGDGASVSTTPAQAQYGGGNGGHGGGGGGGAGGQIGNGLSGTTTSGAEKTDLGNGIGGVGGNGGNGGQGADGWAILYYKA